MKKRSIKFPSNFDFLNDLPLPELQAGINGFPSPAAEYIADGIDLNQILMPNPTPSFIGRLKGDSLAGIGLYEDDLVIVDRSIEPKTGDIIAATLNGKWVCKIIDREQRLLISPTDGFNDYVVSEGDDFLVEGVIYSSARILRPTKKG